MKTNLTKQQMVSFDWAALSASMAVAGDTPVLTSSQLRAGVESGTVELYVAEEGYVEHFVVSGGFVA